MTRDSAMCRIWLTLAVAFFIWLCGLLYFQVASSRAHPTPLLWELFGWSVFGSAALLALVSIWWWLE